jgi:predicted naringenin-chalcone synthase
MVWFADDNGLRLELSQDLPDTLAAHVPGAVHHFLDASGLSQAAIEHWLVHPGGPQILDAVEVSLGLRADALRLSRSVLRRFGNMSSPTILFILKELLETRVNGHCLAMAFGPGLTVELVLLEIRHAGGHSSP